LTGERVIRRLAAILAADVVGYSRLMGRDENGTLARLKAHRTERLEPTLVRHGGRLVKLTGDGALVEFPSAVDALGAAIEFQQAMAEANRDQAEDTAIVFRIGLHLGDLIVEGDDLYGDGVNVAARLEAEAPPGGIVVSHSVRDAVDGRLKATLRDLGELALKNIERPVRAFGVAWNQMDWVAPALSVATPLASAMSLPVDAAPRSPPPTALSIVVLPFTNLSSDPEQEFFVDGVTEDLTTDLSRLSGSVVIARNTAFTYKGQPVDVKRIGRELGVRYVLEGSVRRSGNQVRVNAQLIDAASGAHIWADRFDGDRAELFNLQDEITGRIANALRVELLNSASREAERRHIGQVEALDLVMQGRAIRQRPSTPEGLARARQLFESALALDDRLVDGWAGLAYVLGSTALNFPDAGRAELIVRGEEAVARALVLDPNHLDGHFAAGRLHLARRRLEQAVTEYETTIALDRNYVAGWAQLGVLRNWQGRPTECIPLVEKAIRLSPRDPFLGNWQSFIGQSLVLLGDNQAAMHWLLRSVSSNPNYHFSRLWLAAVQWFANDHASARASIDAARKISPELSLSWFATNGSPVMPAYQWASDRVRQAWREAGLPE
jgi:TolB-like protein/class 3 adenylate cyclase